MRESGIYQMYLKNLLDRLLALVGTAALSWLLILLGIWLTRLPCKLELDFCL